MLKLNPVRRFEGNPIITPDMMPFKCYSVFNSGAIMFNGKILLLLRVETDDLISNFYVAESTDGINFTISPNSINYPFTEYEEKYSIDRKHRFDLRITEIDGKYYVCHAIWTKFGCTGGIAVTENFVDFQAIGDTSVPTNRNMVIFPEKINGLYARLERPAGDMTIMWVSYSPDLIFWGKSEPIDIPHYPWNGVKTGAGATPIKTDRGWLLIYHGTSIGCSSENYYLGVALLDLKNPSKILAAPSSFILAAEKEYECIGQSPNVVFTAGAVETVDGTLNIYYCGADTRMCLAQTTVKELLDFCEA